MSVWLTQRLADLAVCVGANVQTGQDKVVLAWDVEHAPLVRAVPESAYCRGARFVSAVYWDAQPQLMEDIPPERAVRDFMPSTPSCWEAVDRGDLVWPTVPGVCPGLSQAMLGTPEVDRLWGVLTPILRLDCARPPCSGSTKTASRPR